MSGSAAGAGMGWRRVRVWAVTFQYEPREGKKPSGGLGLETDAIDSSLSSSLGVSFYQHSV